MRINFFFKTLLFFILFGFWSFFTESRFIKVEKIAIKIKNLSPSFEKTKIAHISDLHSRNFGKKEKELIRSLKELNPEFIFITGDLVDWETRNLASCRNFWKELSKNFPEKIFGVFGNHDHKNPKFKDIRNFLKESGIKILENEAVKIRKNGDMVYLIGLDDPHEDRDNIDKAMAGINELLPKILLAHSPEVFRRVRERNLDLILVGHTHGGQVNIPFITDVFLPLKHEKKYKRGIFKENSTYLYVNRGIGTTLLPIRFNSPPEIALITLISN